MRGGDEKRLDEMRLQSYVMGRNAFQKYKLHKGFKSDNGMIRFTL